MNLMNVNPDVCKWIVSKPGDDDVIEEWLADGLIEK
jgi:hypothetical protein